MPVTADESDSWHNHVVISEVLASPSDADHNGTDWNGDGYIGQSSDQFIELWNPTDQTINISNWVLDDIIGEGSPSCSIGWNTELAPGARLAFFRDNTRIELDYWDGDTVNLLDDQGNIVHSMTYAPEDSWWDVPFTILEDGSYLKDFDGPSPGADEPANWTGPSVGGSCYTISDTQHKGAYILKGRIVTMASEGAVFDGGILVEDGTIASVWSGANIPTEHEGISVVETDGTIYPGLIDAHNHIHYNTVPLWDIGDNVYNNRYQWKNNPGYKPEVTWPKTLLSSGSYWNMEYEALKYAEMKTIAGGTTAVQGNPTGDDDAYTSVLSRNVEHYNFGSDEMHTKVTELEEEYVGNHIKTGSSAGGDGTLDAWFLHLSEGTDSSSLNEFEILVNNDLLVPELMLIHGVPLGPSEYAQMGAVGASLVWSPTSNLLLYGETANIAAAHEAGVNIALAPDWSPSGSKSPLHEMKLADWLDTNRYGDIFSDYEQVEMVTTNVVDGIGWAEEVGRIQVGLAADLVVVNTFHENPYRNLIEAIDPDVTLTVVGGLPIYGDTNLMQQLKGEDKEPITWNGMTKSVDMTYRGVEDGEQSWAEIESMLTMALEFDHEDMYANFGAADDMTFTEFSAWADDTWEDLDSVGLDSIFTWGDERYFDRLNGSVGFNQIGTIDLWSAYYDVAYDDAFTRPYIDDPNYPTEPEPVVCTEDLCWDGSSRDPVDCSCPEEPELEPEPTTNLKVTPGDYTILGELADVEGDWTAKATANQIIINVDGNEDRRLDLDSETNQYSYDDSGSKRTLELHSFDEVNKSYTGVDWGGATITLKSVEMANSGNDDSEQNAASESQLIDVGIIAAIIVILLSLMAIQSMRNQDE